jgi:hypothetical protein
MSRSEIFCQAPYCARAAVTAVIVSDPSAGVTPSVSADVAAGSAPHLRHWMAVPELASTVSVIASRSSGRNGKSRWRVRAT